MQNGIIILAIFIKNKDLKRGGVILHNFLKNMLEA